MSSAFQKMILHSPRCNEGQKLHINSRYLTILLDITIPENFVGVNGMYKPEGGHPCIPQHQIY